jgi:hypothetical protein
VREGTDVSVPSTDNPRCGADTTEELGMVPNCQRSGWPHGFGPSGWCDPLGRGEREGSGQADLGFLFFYSCFPFYFQF